MYWFQRNLNALKNKIKKWNKEEFGNIFEDKYYLEECLENIQKQGMKDGYFGEF